PSAAAEVPEPASATLNMEYVAQEVSLWCWAACVEMVGRRLGVQEPSPARCAVASRLVGRDCCNSFLSDLFPCNQSATAEQIEGAFAQIRAVAQPVPGTLTEGALWRALAADHVVQLGYDYTGTSFGHVLLIGGYEFDGQELRFDVLDPDDSEGRRL